MSDLKPYIAKAAAGTALNREDARGAFEIIMSGAATPSQIGGFLMALRVRGETVDEIYGAVGSMRARMLPVDVPEDAMDIVGTGGDGTGTYNISTLAAIIVALSLASDRGGRAPRAALATIGSIWSMVGGIVGLVMILTWTVTDHTFMYRNENLLQFTPLSLPLVVMLPRLFLGAVTTRTGRVLVVMVAALSVLGVVLQLLPAFDPSNGEIIALALPVHLALAWAAWRVVG